MEDCPHNPFTYMTCACWLALVGIAVFMSGPLFFAWAHDPSLRLGEYIFVCWFVGVVLHWRWPPSKWPWTQTLFVVVAVAFLFLGILGELQALVYLALSFLICLPVRRLSIRLLFSFAGVIWTPLWSWTIGPFLGASLGIVSLVLAVILATLSIAIRFCIHEPKANRSTF